MVMSAVCSRPGCSEIAVATFSFSPADLQAWLGDFDHNPRSLGQHLCRTHADRVSVPSGWTLVDDRTAPVEVSTVEPSSPMLARAFRSARAS